MQEFARLLEGPKRQGLSKRQGLFLRLDGPAIFMVVSTVLQFPFSWLLSKITYFFIDTLVNYKNDSKALVTLQRYVDAPDLRKEVKRRQRHIFSQLLQRLRELLFDQSMDIRVRRLVGQSSRSKASLSDLLRWPDLSWHYVKTMLLAGVA